MGIGQRGYIITVKPYFYDLFTVIPSMIYMYSQDFIFASIHLLSYYNTNIPESL